MGLGRYDLLFHDGDTIRAFHILRWILPSGEEYGRDNVGCVCVEASNATGHGASNQVLSDIQFHKRVDIALENVPDDIAGNDRKQ